MTARRAGGRGVMAPTRRRDVVKLRECPGDVYTIPGLDTTRGDLAMQPQYTLPDGSIRIPLHVRDGSVYAYATVDATDAEWVRQWHWKIPTTRGSYAYRTERVDGKLVNVTLHRSLVGLGFGDSRECDHIDRDTLNNRRSNLRILPKGANAQNQPSHRGSSSQYRGVSWNKKSKRWHAQINVSGKVISLGDFKDEDVAGQAAREARLRLMPYAVD